MAQLRTILGMFTFCRLTHCTHVLKLNACHRPPNNIHVVSNAIFSLIPLLCCRPHMMFLNPLQHKTIGVESAVRVDSNHMLVVYRRLADSSVERRIIDGPAVFLPTADEW